MHYQSCLFAGRLLGDAIPDIRALTLETLQQAWLSIETSAQMRKHGRTMLTRMLEVLIAQESAASPSWTQEYARAIHWLEAIRLKENISAKPYLSETAFNAVLDGCLEDIIQGLAYAPPGGPGPRLAPSDQCTLEVEAVLHWGIALIILIMAFTGLRRQSIVRLTVDDMARLGPQAFALAWQHGKPAKQQIAIIPALVAEHLQHYIHATAPIREHLGTQQIFLARNHVFRWDQMTVTRVSKAFDSFVYRHSLQQADSPLRLGSTLLRRTYVTRALYEFPSIAALQAQLGHNDPKTTLLYAQHDRYAHPAHVDNALDAFGRKVLVRWHKPLLLEDLPDAERQILLGVQVARSQEVGMCRHDCCVKLDEERLPPCSLCEHLVSGPEYLMAWEQEKAYREQQLEHLGKLAGAELLFAQMKGQYDRFLVNYRFIQERSQA